MDVILLGAGRLATHLAKALYNKGVNILMVWSRTIDSAQLLASKIDSHASNDLDTVKHLRADFWIYALADDAIADIAVQLPDNGTHVHTSGSVGIDVFSTTKSSYASIYPLQTFSIDREVTFDNIPLFYEASNSQSEISAINFCKLLSERVYELNSEKRRHLHLAAVFACNFANALWASAEQILENEAIPVDVLYPLIQETLSKAIAMGAENSQTGPAIRHDQEIIDKHQNMLSDNLLLQEIYKNITTLIQSKK